MNKEDKNAMIFVAVFLAINAVIVCFGRLYFPINFSPDKISFFENYWVLVLGEIVITSIFCIWIICVSWLLGELFTAVKLILKSKVAQEIILLINRAKF